jgi:hypothetical protein
VDGSTNQEEAFHINVNSPGGPKTYKGGVSINVGGPKEKEHILRGGINDANTSKGIHKYKDM